MPYSEKLKMIKEEKGLTSADISKIGNLPLPTVIRALNKTTQNASFETMIGMARGLNISLDELAGLKQPNEQPLPSPIIETLNSYSELLKEKDERIAKLEEEKEIERKERRTLTKVLVILVALLLAILAIDLLNGHIGTIRY